jgi:transposase
VEALEGRVQPHQRFILAELLCQLDNLEQAIARFDEEVLRCCQPFTTVVELLDTIPGVGRQTAEMLVSEIGVARSRFPGAAHLAAWAGLAPGNYKSAGKRLAGKTRKGNQTLRSGLMQSAHVASRARTYLAAQYRRLATRPGKKRATMAVAHSLLVMAYRVIQRQEPYRELGVQYFDQQRPEATAKRLVKRLETLGYQVSVQPQEASAAA